MDIYARFLFLNDDIITHNTKFLKILSYQLLAYHKLADHKMFENLLVLHRDRLDEMSPDYPRTWKEFKYDWLNDKGFLFPPSKNFLIEEKMKTSSPRVAKIFGSQRQCEIYDHLSQLLHGNAFMAHDLITARYWLASMSLSTTAFFLEVIDNRVFRNDKRKDLREWLKEVKEKKLSLIESWPKGHGTVFS